MICLFFDLTGTGVCGPRHIDCRSKSARRHVLSYTDGYGMTATRPHVSRTMSVNIFRGVGQS